MNIGLVLQMRMASVRLPYKGLLPIGGPSILTRLINQMHEFKYPGHVIDCIVATTRMKEDSIIHELCGYNICHCFRGDSEDVLKRFYDVMDDFDLDIIVRLTGDNPVILPNAIKTCLDYLITNKIDFIRTTNLPHGLNVEIFSRDGLNLSHLNAMGDEREHITQYAIKHFDKVLDVPLPASINPDLNYSIDTPEQYEAFIKEVAI
jgi:spore coat polysaccharide biosynthesis protein SpsF